MLHQPARNQVNKKGPVQRTAVAGPTIRHRSGRGPVVVLVQHIHKVGHTGSAQFLPLSFFYFLSLTHQPSSFLSLPDKGNEFQALFKESCIPDKTYTLAHTHTHTSNPPHPSSIHPLRQRFTLPHSSRYSILSNPLSSKRSFLDFRDCAFRSVYRSASSRTTFLPSQSLPRFAHPSSSISGAAFQSPPRYS